MHGNDVLVFLLSLGLLLGVARLVGEIARNFGLPQVVGELSTGILLGQTGLKRIWPEAYDFLFSAGPAISSTGSRGTSRTSPPRCQRIVSYCHRRMARHRAGD